MSRLYWKWKQNFVRPGVFPGSFLVFRSMNRTHRPLWEFSLQHVELPLHGSILDVGCGGGGFLREMSLRAPEAALYGVDYSPLSVKRTLRSNRDAVRAGRMVVRQGSVSALPFESNQFDLVTATETTYFWPNPPEDFREVARVLKPGGRFAIACDCADREAGRKYADRLNGMRIHTADDFAAFFAGAGLTLRQRIFSGPDGGMLCMEGVKPEE